MTALTQATVVYGDPHGSPRYAPRFDVAAGAIIYHGALIFVNGSGYAVSASPDQSMTCVGWNDGPDVDNTAGDAGDKTIVPRIGAIDLASGTGGDAISADDAGKMAYAVDDQTAALTSGGGTRPAIGPIMGMYGTKVRVVAGAPGSRAIQALEAASIATAPVVTTQAWAGGGMEFSLGSLTTGLLKHVVTAGVSSPATAVAGTDYYAPGATDVTVADGGTGASTAAAARANLSAAPADAQYLTATATAELSAELNVGAQASGALAITVSGGVAALATSLPLFQGAGAPSGTLAGKVTTPVALYVRTDAPDIDNLFYGTHDGGAVWVKCKFTAG